MNIKHNYLYFSIAAMVAVLLRALMLAFAIDGANGFIKSEYSLIATFVFILIILGALLCFAFAFSAKAALEKNKPNSIFFKFFSIALAAVILYDSIFTAPPIGTASIINVLELIAAIVTAAYLLSFVITDYMGVEFPVMFSVAPVFFWFVRLVMVFSSFSTLANISDNLFELASLCLILISSLQASKTLCIRLSAKAESTNFALFLATAFVCFVTALPRALLLISGQSGLLHRNELPILTTVFAGIYFLSFAVNHYKENK